jgi:hypothetical protein
MINFSRAHILPPEKLFARLSIFLRANGKKNEPGEAPFRGPSCYSASSNSYSEENSRTMSTAIE